MESWPPEQARSVLGELDVIESLVVGVRSRVLVGMERTGAHVKSGDHDVAAWRARTSRQGAGAGLGQVRTARALAAMPKVEQALSDGQVTPVTPAHAATLGRVTASASPVVGQALASQEGQAQVVQLARRYDGRAFSQALSASPASWDPAAHQASHEASRAARFLHLSHAADATWIKGRLDAWAGKKLRLALEAVTPRPSVDDARTPEQRSADALELLAAHALNTPPERNTAERPHVTALVSEDT